MSEKVKKIERCRISASQNLFSVLTLGTQALTGVFPKAKGDSITAGPLELVWCPDSGLLQLQHSYDLSEMYGENYGYRSGLNQSMVTHLSKKAAYLESKYSLKDGDFAIDIGSNDGTLLNSYSTSGLKRVGIDPTGSKFRQHYKDGVELIPDFFSASLFESNYPGKLAKIVTSVSMFYDLEDPSSFVADVRDVLDKDGLWHFEQSYMPAMLRTNSYDTVCHEHLEYYSLGVVNRLLERNGLKVLDVQMNGINGGSFAVTAAHRESKQAINRPVIDWLIGQEDRLGLDTPRPYRDFEERVYRHLEDLVRLIRSLRADGRLIVGYGASTKGNVLLQFCGLGDQDISCIAEVNPEKFGSFTPGTLIPIHSEADVRKMRPDYMLVLPWHFRDSIVKREAEYLEKGGKLIFPMPEIEIV